MERIKFRQLTRYNFLHKSQDNAAWKANFLLDHSVIPINTRCGIMICRK